MKKLLLFFIVGSCFFSSIAEIKHSDAAMAAIKKRPCSKKYAHTESVVAGAAVSGLSGALIFKMWQKGYLISKEVAPCLIAEVIALPLVFIGAFLLDSKYGVFPQQTASAFFKLGHQIVLGDLAKDELYNKVLDIAEGSAINLINEIVEAYGFERSEERLEIIKKTLNKAREYLFDVLDNDSEKELTKEELVNLELARKKANESLGKVIVTQKLVAFKKEFTQATNIIDNAEKISQELLEGEKTEIKVSTDVASAESVEQLKRRILEKKKFLPYRCISKKEFEKFIKKSGKVAKKLREIKARDIKNRLKKKI